MNEFISIAFKIICFKRINRFEFYFYFYFYFLYIYIYIYILLLNKQKIKIKNEWGYIKILEKRTIILLYHSSIINGSLFVGLSFKVSISNPLTKETKKINIKSLNI
jgi:hypothetical protein